MCWVRRQNSFGLLNFNLKYLSFELPYKIMMFLFGDIFSDFLVVVSPSIFEKITDILYFNYQ